MLVFWDIRIYKGVIRPLDNRFRIDDLWLFVNLHMSVLFFDTTTEPKDIVPTAALPNTAKGTKE